jgi:hypothetical protein
MGWNVERHWNHERRHPFKIYDNGEFMTFADARWHRMAGQVAGVFIFLIVVMIAIMIFSVI